MRNPPTAVNFYDQALTLNPNNYDAHYNKGLVLFSQYTRLDTSKILFETSDKIKKGDPLVNFYIGVSYISLNDIFSCPCYFKRTIRFSGRNISYYIKICEHLMKMSQNTLASVYCNEGLFGNNHPTNRRLREIRSILDSYPLTHYSLCAWSNSISLRNPLNFFF